MRKFIIKKNDSGQRIDSFFQKVAPDTPYSLMHKLFRKKDILLNGNRVSPSENISTGDVVEIYLHDKFFAEPNFDFLNAPDDINVIYEDENIIIIDKPQGLLTHAGRSGEEDTLISRTLHYLYNKGDYDPCKEKSFTPAFCNRIDRNTRGIVLGAKNFRSLQLLNQKIKNREITRKYICLVHGIPSLKNDILTGYHLKDSTENKVLISSSFKENSKKVITSYRVLEEYTNTSLLEVEIITGRSHQIRAHLASIQHPVVGDTKYGGRPIDSSTGQKLVSYHIGFNFTEHAGHLEYLKNKNFEINPYNIFK